MVGKDFDWNQIVLKTSGCEGLSGLIQLTIERGFTQIPNPTPTIVGTYPKIFGTEKKSFAVFLLGWPGIKLKEMSSNFFYDG